MHRLSVHLENLHGRLSLDSAKKDDFEVTELKCGYLWKKGGGIKSSAWKLRWVRLTKSKKLYYFKTANKVKVSRNFRDYVGVYIRDLYRK
jgi:hypothetical protein